MPAQFRHLNAKPFVWLDTETTGLDPEVAEVIEIAMIQVDVDGTETVLIHTKIKPDRIEDAHPIALKVNGYTEEAWADAPSQIEVWTDIYDRYLLSNCVLAGQNVKFDIGMIKASLKRAGFDDYRFDYHSYDTVTLAIAYLKPLMKSVSLVPCCVALAIPVKDAHSALADTRMSMELGRVLLTARASERARWLICIPQRLAAWEAAGKPNVWPPVS